MNQEKTQREYNCEYCKDTGIIPQDEAVHPNEPYKAALGDRPCNFCQDIDIDDDYDQFIDRNDTPI